MPVTPVSDWGAAIITSVSDALAMFLGTVPKVIGFIVILLIGWFIASAIASAVAALLRTVTFNDLAQRSGVSGFVQNMGVRTDAACRLRCSTPSLRKAQKVAWFRHTESWRVHLVSASL